MTREELIAALETATGPKYVLDEAISCWRFAAYKLPPLRPACYTSSIDAALALVPEGMWWHIGAGRTRADEPLYGAVILWPGDNPKPPYACDEVGAGEHPTSQAIALCIAALKAQGGGA
jgi:hypothetical protein